MLQAVIRDIDGFYSPLPLRICQPIDQYPSKQAAAAMLLTIV